MGFQVGIKRVTLFPMRKVCILRLKFRYRITHENPPSNPKYGRCENGTKWKRLCKSKLNNNDKLKHHYCVLGLKIEVKLPLFAICASISVIFYLFTILLMATLLF